MRMKMLRGAREVGGNCLELTSGASRILVDYGLSLDEGKAVVLTEPESIDAVLVSHAHPDHAGALDLLPARTPVFCAEATRRFIQASRVFHNQGLSSRDFRPFVSGATFEFGAFRVTPFLMDHSAADAHAFLIEADGRKLLYSGDFRRTGRKPGVMSKMIRALSGGVDALVIEGTQIEDGGSSNCANELEVESMTAELLQKSDRLGVAVFSGQNIDRLVSLYKAARSANRIFVMDIYTAWIAEEFRAVIGRDTIPSYGWDEVKVLAKGFTAGRHYEVLKNNPDYFGDFRERIYDEDNVVANEDISASPSRYLVKSSYAAAMLERLKLPGLELVYSMWPGYLELENNKELLALKDNSKVGFHIVHASGHASRAAIAEFINSVAPEKVIPIHTTNGEAFKELSDCAMVLDDQEEMEI